MKAILKPVLYGAVILSLCILLNCENATDPRGGSHIDLSSEYSAGISADTIPIGSGSGACGEYDPYVFVKSPCDTNLQPALIGGGSPASECSCSVIGDTLYPSLPVATRCDTDSFGYFVTYFDLPQGFFNASLHMGAIADDGALIYLNGAFIAQIDLSGAAPREFVYVHILEDSLFMEGENSLSFEVVNTQVASYGEPVGRADTADCMYLEFYAELIYEEAPVVTIDIKPGSDTNPVNCKSMKGVIPVAILTTDEFDAAGVDHTTVRFGPDGAAEAHSNKHGMIRHVEDVDLDGDMDLVFHFRSYETGIACGDTSATLWGMTLDGREFMDSDKIRTVGDNDHSGNDDGISKIAHPGIKQ